MCRFHHYFWIISWAYFFFYYPFSFMYYLSCFGKTHLTYMSKSWKKRLKVNWETLRERKTITKRTSISPLISGHSCNNLSQSITVTGTDPEPGVHVQRSLLPDACMFSAFSKIQRQSCTSCCTRKNTHFRIIKKWNMPNKFNPVIICGSHQKDKLVTWWFLIRKCFRTS